MITLLSKIFIKNHDDVTNPAVRKAYGMLCSLTGIFLNVLLFAGKYIAGTIAGSIAVTADAFNNLSDAGSSVITLLGFRMASKKPDPDHPFGHGRIEYLSGLAVSLIIIVVGVQLGLESIDKIRSPEEIDASLLPMSGAVVAVFIIYSGFSAARDTLSPLLGSAPDPELVKRIVDIVMAHPEVLNVHDLVVHDYGPGRLMVSLHAEVPGDGDIYELHDAIDTAEYELQRELGCSAVIHMDPVSTDDSKTGRMRDELAEAVDGLGYGITIHDFRIVDGPTHTNVIFDAVLPNDSPLTEDEAKKTLETLVNSLWENTHPKVHIDRPFV